MWGCLLLKYTTLKLTSDTSDGDSGCTAKATEVLLLELESFELGSS